MHNRHPTGPDGGELGNRLMSYHITISRLRSRPPLRSSAQEFRKAASLAAPLLSGAPFRAVLDWFNEWAVSYEKLEQVRINCTQYGYVTKL